MANYYEAVYRLVRAIPRGRVMTYGQVAAALGQPRGARAVGYALRVCPADVPWQRVINRHGQISRGGQPERPKQQAARLTREGVAFDAEGRCDLTRYQWHPPAPEAWHFEGSVDFPFR